MVEHEFNKTIRKHLGIPKSKPNYNKISWKELEAKLNLEIKEQEDSTDKRITQYLEYLKGELEVELFIK